MDKKQEQHKLVNEIFARKNFNKNFQFFEKEIKEIVHGMIDEFDMPTQNLLALQRLQVGAFKSRNQDSEFVGFFDYYPMNFEAKIVDTSRIGLKQGNITFGEVPVDLSVLDDEIKIKPLKTKQMDTQKLEMLKFATHELTHMLAGREIGVISQNGKKLELSDLNTPKAKNAKILVFNGGNELMFACCDEKGKIITHQDRTDKLNADIVDIVQEDFEEGTIGAMLNKNENVELEFEDFGTFDGNNQYNMNTVVLNQPENTRFGEQSKLFHEGITELLAQKLVLSGNVECFKPFAKHPEVFEESKGYYVETAYIKMVEALNGKAVEDVYFYGTQKWPLPVLNKQFCDDFCAIFESFSVVFDLLQENEMFFEEIEEAETKKQKKELAMQQKELQEKIVLEFDEFCKDAQSVLKRQQKDVKKSFDEGKINFKQLKNYLIARNEFVDSHQWFFDYFYGCGIDEKKIENVMTKNLKCFVTEFENKKKKEMGVDIEKIKQHAANNKKKSPQIEKQNTTNRDKMNEVIKKTKDTQKILELGR